VKKTNGILVNCPFISLVLYRYLEEYPGYRGMSTLLKSTNLVLDRVLFEMVVELACTGTFRQSSPVPPTPSSGVRLSGPNMQNVYPIIASMVHPQALHSSLLPCMNVDPESSVSFTLPIQDGP
jgi:hypothetical protein